MYITDNLIKFLNNSMILSDSTIILTNLDKVVFVASNDNNNYLNKRLHNDLKRLLNLYTIDSGYADYMNVSMDTIVPIVEDDDISKYKSQIVLPVIHNDTIDGLLIFITDKREYLDSNLKYAKTAKHFVEIFSTKDYL